MDEYSNFETFLYISPEKLIISVNKKDDLRNIYLNELMIEGNNETDLLYDFLDKNIYKIEKILKNFIKTINIIIESDILFPVQMSVKRSNYGEVTS